MKLVFQKEQLEALAQKHYAQVYKAVTPYMKLSVCTTNVSMVMKKMYIEQFKDAYASFENNINWEKTFAAYLNFFTLDKLLVEFAKESNTLEILRTIPLVEINREGMMYPQSILIKG